MKTYLILTESTPANDKRTIALAKERFLDGFTVLHGVGHWQGQSEKSLGILVVGSSLAMVQALCVNIKLANRQQTVLVLAWDADVLFI